MGAQQASGGRLRPSRIGLPRPTGTAWALGLFCLALLGAAINTGNNLLYLLFGLLTAAVPVSLGASLLNLARLRGQVQAPETIQAGMPFTLTVHLHNQGRRPARGLRVRVLTSGGVVGPSLVEYLPGGQRIRVRLAGGAMPRGPLHILGIRLGTIAPLGLVERRRFFPDSVTVLAVPAAVRRPLAEAGARPVHGSVSRDAGRLGEEYRGLRRGREEDDIRRVDWKTSARRGELVVRETSGEARPFLAFDLRTVRSGDADLARVAFEGEVAFHAGRSRSVLEAGGEVVMTLDGEAPTPYRGASGLVPLLRRLARIEPVDGSGRPLPPLPPAQAAQPVPLPVTQAVRVLRRAAVAALGIGTVALYAYDGLGTTAFVALLVGLALAMRRGAAPAPLRPWPQRLWKVAGVLALALFVTDLVLLRHNPLNASLNLIAFIALYKMFNARDARDDRQMILVSLLMIILAASLTTGVSFALPLVAWLAAVTYAQVARAHLPLDRGRICRPAPGRDTATRWRYAGPTVSSLGGLVVVGLLLFATIPHLGTGTFAPGILRPGAASGFSETTRLGDIGRIKQDFARVMQVRVEEGRLAESELRWRGMALDRFDGRVWTRTAAGLDWAGADGSGWFVTRGEPESPRFGPVATELVQAVRLDPSSQRVLFAAAAVDRVRSDDFLFLAEDGTGALLFPGRPGRGLTYTAVSRVPSRDDARLRAATGSDPLRVRGLHLQLPPLDPRIRELARRLTAGRSSRYDAAAAIESWLMNSLTYSLDVDDTGRDDPLAAFLFEGMAGHCEYFATGMVILARASGIPARLATGYLRGERSRFGPLYTVRRSDAHAWVEVFFPGTGWVAFDPTPAAGRGDWQDGNWLTLMADLTSSVARLWDDYIIGIDMADQARGFLSLRDLVGGVLTRAGSRLQAGAPAGRTLAVWAMTALLVAALVWALLRSGRNSRWHRGPNRGKVRAPVFYGRLLQWLARRQLVRRPGETPAELAERAALTLPEPLARRVRDLTDLYYRVRYDGADRAGARRLARRLLSDLRQAGPGPFPPGA